MMNSLLNSKKISIFAAPVNAGVHRTYSMFVEILEKSPNFEDRGGECSPPLLCQNLYLSSYDEVIIVYL